MRSRIVLLAVAAFAVGCMSVGSEFPVSQVREIEIGTTTRDDVRKLFGQPWRTGLEDGTPTWTYGHYKYNLIGASQTRDLVVRFDDRGVVRSYTFNSTYPQDVQ